MTELEKRIEVLEAKEEIKELKAKYAVAADNGHNPECMASLFTEDGIFEAAGVGKIQGYEQLHALFSQFGPVVSLSHHAMVNPVIKVDGNTAIGTWYLIGMFKYTAGDRKWMAQNYEETYEKTKDGWKIKHLKAPVPKIDATLEAGW